MFGVMQFAALGPVCAVDRGEPVHLGGPRHHAVLGVLIARVDRAVPIDVIITEVWGDDAGERAVASLYTHVSNLRGAVGKNRIVSEGGGYRLALNDGDDVDIARFEDSLTEARRRSGVDPAGAVEALEKALGLWRGRPYEGLEDIPMLTAEITRLSELSATAQMDRFEALLQTGDAPLVADLEEVCGRRPLDERPWNLLMRTLYRVGRQAEALRTYTHVRDLFGEEMGIEPSPSLARLEEQILLHDPILDERSTVRPASLPTYLTSFVGRDSEMREIAELLSEHRFVTIVGPGGAGKTRLATEMAATLHGRFPDGVWLIDLAQVSDPTRVAAAIAASVGATGTAGDSTESTVAAISGRRVLVILDNCEHVVDAVRAAAEAMLRSAPGPVVLATSRMALGSPGEHCFTLGGLAVEGADDASGDAVMLFRERASAVRPIFDQADASVEAIETICWRLDGMPLALELAAAHSDVLSPIEIADLLARRFSILVDDRQRRDIHRSLEATIGWSYGLLTPDNRTSFAELGVFEGPFTAEDAAAILNKNRDDAIAVIEALTAASLIRVEPHGRRPTTYRLLETLSGYAQDRLTESGRWEEIVQRHDHHFLGVCSDLMVDLLIAGRPDALARVASVAAELLVAWDRLGEEDSSLVMPIAWALGNHWLVRGGIAEGEQRIRDVLDATVGRTVPLRMNVLLIGALLAERRGHRESARAWSDEALEIAERAGDIRSIVVALNFAGRLRVEQGDYVAAIALLDRSMALAGHAPQHGGSPGLADGRVWALVTLAEARRWSGDTTSDVRDHLYEARRHFRSIDDAEGQLRADRVLVTIREIPIDERLRLAGEMMSLARSGSADGEMHVIAFRALASVMWEMDDRAQANVLNRAAIRSAMAYGSLIDLGSVLLQAAMFAGFTGRGDLAAKLAGAGQHQCGMQHGPFQQAGLEQLLEHERSEMGDDRFDELYRIGAAMDAGEAAAYALG